MESVTFKNREVDVVADLRFPAGFSEDETYAAIICAHPISSCKEQTSGLYAERLTALGYITLTFDASYQGHSGGEPRHLEDPAARVEDFRCAVDFLLTKDYVDEDRIAVLGICGGGYAANATMTDHRIKALGTVVAANYGRLLREGDLGANAAIAGLEQVGQQRTAEARGAEPAIGTYIPDSPEQLEQSGIEDIDIVNAVEYYRTPRGQQPGAPNKLRLAGLEAAYGFDAFHLAEQLLTQPLQVIIGSVPGGFGSYRDGFELFERARSEHKNLAIIEGASHYDLYDRPEYVDQALEKPSAFYVEYVPADARELVARR